MYIEASLRELGDIARLISPAYVLHENSHTCILEFWYHMYGLDIATLNVYSRCACVDNTETLLWSLSGNRLDAWHLARISFAWLHPFASQVIF